MKSILIMLAAQWVIASIILHISSRMAASDGDVAGRDFFTALVVNLVLFGAGALAGLFAPALPPLALGGTLLVLWFVVVMKFYGFNFMRALFMFVLNVAINALIGWALWMAVAPIVGALT